MRSNERFQPHLVRPTDDNTSSNIKSESCPEHEVYATDDEEEQSDGDEKADTTQEETAMPIGIARPNAEQTIQEEEDEAEGGKNTKIVRNPGTPSVKERQEHEVHHWPYRSWCDHCVKGRALGQPHKTMTGQYAESSVARILMDYGYLHEEEVITQEEHGTQGESKVSLTAMVMLETMCSGVWAYALDAKGGSTLDWLAKTLVEDIEIVGLSN